MRPPVVVSLGPSSRPAATRAPAAAAAADREVPRELPGYIFCDLGIGGGALLQKGKVPFELLRREFQKKCLLRDGRLHHLRVAGHLSAREHLQSAAVGSDRGEADPLVVLQRRRREIQGLEPVAHSGQHDVRVILQRVGDWRSSCLG